MMDINEMLLESSRREELRHSVYDPVSGLGCGGPRREITDARGVRLMLPEAMTSDAAFSPAMDAVALERMRCHYDFEFWAWRCARIRHKLNGRRVPFVLNRPQRHLLGVMERQRLAGSPIRVILLKARQWGGSTLTQLYMAWIQIEHCRNWHSIICAHVKDASATIRNFYTSLLADYPREMWPEPDDEPCFSPFEGSLNSRVIGGRGCRVTIGSCENPEASRGADIAMAHLSEVAFWRASRLHDPHELLQAVVAGIPRVPLSLVVMESTANGVGSFFHREWLRAVAGDSAFEPVFVPWHEIDIYAEPPANAAALAASLDADEQALWQQGLSLPQLEWRRAKRRELGSDRRMMAEYPASPLEAFTSTGVDVFDVGSVERLRQGCRPADGIDGTGDHDGVLTWQPPLPDAEYVVTVDVGGRSAGSDWSVILVMRRPVATPPGVAEVVPEVVAQWRGHEDYDLLARRARELALRYNEALLVIESNTPENISARNGEPSVLLDLLADTYSNYYYRTTADAMGMRPGFHTNRETKAAMIANLQRCIREGDYIERCNDAIDELLTYEQLPSGSWAAKSGCHDDLLMTRAMALYIILHEPAPLPADALRPPSRQAASFL